MSTTDFCKGCAHRFCQVNPAFAKAEAEGCHDQICNNCAFANPGQAGVFTVKDVQYIPLAGVTAQPKEPVAHKAAHDHHHHEGHKHTVEELAAKKEAAAHNERHHNHH